MGEVRFIRPELDPAPYKAQFGEAVMWGVAERQARIDFQTTRGPEITPEEIEVLTAGTKEKLSQLPPELRTAARMEILKLTRDYPRKEEQ